jgi:addiction module RelE/StbE family toxin
MGINDYHLKIVPAAMDDLDDIYSYITNHLSNEDAAIHLMDRIESNIKRLKKFPLSCSLVRDDILREKGYRKLIIDHYVVFYLVDETKKQVNIMRVLYGKRKYEDLL